MGWQDCWWEAPRNVKPPKDCSASYDAHKQICEVQEKGNYSCDSCDDPNMCNSSEYFSKILNYSLISQNEPK